MNSQQTSQVLDSAEILFLNNEGSYISLEQLSKDSQVAEAELRQEFPNENLVCSAWLNRTDERSEKIHEAILLESKPAVQKIEDYFSSLISYMEENQYRGCVFTRVASRLGSSQEEQPVTDSITKHKANLLKFFFALASEVTSIHAQTLSNSLFLLYSGATTESRNSRSLTPVRAAKESAMLLCNMYA